MIGSEIPQTSPSSPTLGSTLARRTRDLLHALNQQELFVVALYLRAGSMNKGELYEHADTIRKLSRRELLMIVLETPAHQISEATVHILAGALHPRRAWMKYRAESDRPQSTA
jgi:hypothetical protein